MAIQSIVFASDFSETRIPLFGPMPRNTKKPALRPAFPKNDR